MNEIKNADMPAMPTDAIETRTDWDELTGGGRFIPSNGLTKRETVLMEFMKAMLSNPEMDYGYKDGCKALAGDAMGYVNAYFEELEK